MCNGVRFAANPRIRRRHPSLTKQAATKAHVTQQVTLTFPITKKKINDDGSRTIYGKVTGGEVVDRDGQIVDPDWAAEKLKDWFDDLGGPIRNMHSGNYPPAGKGIQLDLEDDGAYIAAKIVEPTAIKLLDMDIYRDLSIGIAEANLYHDPVAPNGRLGKAGDNFGWVNEVSLVDVGSHPEAHILQVAKRAKRKAPIELAEIIGDITPDDLLSKALAAQVGKAKDPDVGGGVDRSKIPRQNFVFPDDAPEGGFPIVKPGDVSDAVSSWGRYEGSESFDTFKQRLTSIARRLGPSFVAELPDSWGKEKKKVAGMKKCKACKGTKSVDGAECAACKGTGKMPMDKATDAATTKAAAPDMPEGHVVCGSCEGGKIKGELPCPKCDGKGHYDPSAKSKKAKKGHDSADDAVQGALDNISDDLDDAQSAQGADDDKSTGSVAVSAPAQDGTMKPTAGPTEAAMVGDRAPVGDTMTKAERKALRKAEKAKAKAGADGGDGGSGDGDGKPMPPWMKPKKKKATKALDIPYLAMRAHDMVCPCFSTKTVRKSYGDVTPEMLDPDWFQRTLADAASRKMAPGSIAEASQAFAAAAGLQSLAPKTFADLARAAHKGFLDANPSLPNLTPGLISPDQFRRQFLPAANAETSSATRVPSPSGMKSPLTAEQFDRGPLSSNQTRPTLDNSGHSVAKGLGAVLDKPVVKRDFYTNSAKDEHAGMMAQVHDFIANKFPGCCPMAGAEGTPTDSDGQMGRPAEVNGSTPVVGNAIDTGGTATISPVTDTSRANKGSGDPLDPKAIDKMVQRAVAKATKALQRDLDVTKAMVKGIAASPDPRADRQRVQSFGRPATKGDKTAQARIERAREAAALIKEKDSRLGNEGLDTLRDMSDKGELSARAFAALAVAD